MSAVRRALAALALVALTGCAELRAAATEDRSDWTAEMKRDAAECEDWAFMMPVRPYPARGFGDWYRSCLRGRGWKQVQR